MHVGVDRVDVEKEEKVKSDEKRDFLLIYNNMCFTHIVVRVRAC